MTNEQIILVTKLSHCTFLPGSSPKRFVRSVLACAAKTPNKPLTDKQDAYLSELFHKYRKQIGSVDHNIYCRLCNNALLAVEAK